MSRNKIQIGTIALTITGSWRNKSCSGHLGCHWLGQGGVDIDYSGKLNSLIEVTNGRFRAS